MKIEHLTTEILTNVVSCEKPYRGIKAALEKGKSTLASRILRFFLPADVLVDLGDIHNRFGYIETLITTYRAERRVKIIRKEKKHGPYIGELYIGERLCYYTLERPDKHAPVGKHKAFLDYSPTRKCMVYELENIEGITELQIHNGNRLKHTKACILIGESHGWLKGERAVLTSKPAFNAFMAEMRENERLILEIKEEWGGQLNGTTL